MKSLIKSCCTVVFCLTVFSSWAPPIRVETTHMDVRRVETERFNDLFGKSGKEFERRFREISLERRQSLSTAVLDMMATQGPSEQEKAINLYKEMAQVIQSRNSRDFDPHIVKIVVSLITPKSIDHLAGVRPYDLQPRPLLRSVLSTCKTLLAEPTVPPIKKAEIATTLKEALVQINKLSIFDIAQIIEVSTFADTPVLKAMNLTLKDAKILIDLAGKEVQKNLDKTNCLKNIVDFLLRLYKVNSLIPENLGQLTIEIDQALIGMSEHFSQETKMCLDLMAACREANVNRKKAYEDFNKIVESIESPDQKAVSLDRAVDIIAQLVEYHPEMINAFVKSKKLVSKLVQKLGKNITSNAEKSMRSFITILDIVNNAPKEALTQEELTAINFQVVNFLNSHSKNSSLNTAPLIKALFQNTTQDFCERMLNIIQDTSLNTPLRQEIIDLLAKRAFDPNGAVKIVYQAASPKVGERRRSSPTQRVDIHATLRLFKWAVNFADKIYSSGIKVDPTVFDIQAFEKISGWETAVNTEFESFRSESDILATKLQFMKVGVIARTNLEAASKELANILDGIDRTNYGPAVMSELFSFAAKVIKDHPALEKTFKSSKELRKIWAHQAKDRLLKAMSSQNSAERIEVLQQSGALIDDMKMTEEERVDLICKGLPDVVGLGFMQSGKKRELQGILLDRADQRILNISLTRIDKQLADPILKKSERDNLIGARKLIVSRLLLVFTSRFDRRLSAKNSYEQTIADFTTELDIINVLLNDKDLSSEQKRDILRLRDQLLKKISDRMGEFQPSLFAKQSLERFKPFLIALKKATTFEPTDKTTDGMASLMAQFFKYAGSKESELLNIIQKFAMEQGLK